jgi:hypothetical protein
MRNAMLPNLDELARAMSAYVASDEGGFRRARCNPFGARYLDFAQLARKWEEILAHE